MDTKKPPFKFLDPFQKDDVGFYFGREDDTKLLYEMIKRNRIVLIYGPSGSGKTSLIRCGLANKFDVTNWLPFYIRRNEDIGAAMEEELRNFLKNVEEPSEQILGDIVKRVFRKRKVLKPEPDFCKEIGLNFTDEELHALEEKSEKDISYESKIGIARLVYFLNKVGERSMRPIYLVFDQLEELLIYGKVVLNDHGQKEEVEKAFFMELLKIIHSNAGIVNCQCIIIMREEFFGLFEKFEKKIPGITEHRMRVDPMYGDDVKNIIRKTLNYKRFNITLQSPEESVDKIFTALANTKDEVSLPYLQVYLDQLWREDYARTYPNGYDGPAEFPPLTVTIQEIEEFGKFKNVLQKFLTERKKIIGKELGEKFRGTSDDFINRVLKEFVSDYGTRVPVVYKYDREEKRYDFPFIEKEFFKGLNPDALQFVLHQLELNKIIRQQPRTLELSHDILAKLIDDQRDARERKRIRIRVNIQQYMKQPETYVSSYDIKEWDNEIGNCNLNEEERAYYDFCKEMRGKEDKERLAQEIVEKRLAAEKQALKERHQQLEKEQLQLQGEQAEMSRIKQKGRMRKIIIIGVIVITTLLGVMAGSLNKANENYALAHSYELDTIADKLNGLRLAKYIYDFRDHKEATKKKLQEKMLDIAGDQFWLDTLSIYKNKVDLRGMFLPQADVDISANGKYLITRRYSPSVTSDTIPSGHTIMVYDITTRKSVDSFTNVNYVYFLDDTDSLVLALNSSDEYGFGFESDKFQVYNCRNRERSAVFDLNPGNSTGSFLYDKGFFDKTVGERKDFSRIRRTASGHLVVPYYSLVETGGMKRTYRNMHIMDGSGHIIRGGGFSLYSTLSPGKTLLLRGYISGNGAKQFYYYNFLSSEFKNIGFVNYAGFTADGFIVMVKENQLQLANSNLAISKTWSIPSAACRSISAIYMDSSNSHAIVQCHEDLIHLIQLNETGQPASKSFQERFIGFNRQRNFFISHSIGYKGEDSTIIDDSILIRRDLTGRKLPRVKVAYGIESFKYNEAVNEIMIMTKRDPISQRKYVMVYDDTLGIKTVLPMTPYDLYGFSKDGQTFFCVRDFSINVFNNQKRYVDFSSFDAINKWMDDSTKIYNPGGKEFNEMRRSKGVKFPAPSFLSLPSIHPR